MVYYSLQCVIRLYHILRTDLLHRTGNCFTLPLAQKLNIVSQVNMSNGEKIIQLLVVSVAIA